VIAILFVLQHLSTAAIVYGKRLRAAYVLLSFSIFCFIYFIKPDTYDIIAYVDAVSYAYVFEPLFALLVLVFDYFTSDERTVIFLVQALLALFLISLSFSVRPNSRLIAISVIIFSVFFTLAVNNALRQGFSSFFLIVFSFSLINRKYLLCTACLLIATGFHLSAIAFGLVLWGVYLVFIFFGSEFLRFRSVSVAVSYLILAVISASGFVFIDLILSAGFYSNYDGMELVKERVPLFVKVVPIFFIFVISEFFLWNKKSSFSLLIVRHWRAFFILFVAVMSLDVRYSEIGARILFFYFGIDLVFQLYCLNHRFFKSLFASVFGSAFAINAWNVLGN
tara:strand:+ start:2037 stop:3044 length:1008 start_codon:yes stop_codon:yes gene_type:complete